MPRPGSVPDPYKESGEVIPHQKQRCGYSLSLPVIYQQSYIRHVLCLCKNVFVEENDTEPCAKSNLIAFKICV